MDGRPPEAPTRHLNHVRHRGPLDQAGRFPDFLILGPQRTGTTWLYHNLRKHPEIFLPAMKETFFFSTLGRPDHAHFRFPYLEDYLAVYREPWKRRIKRNYDCLRSSFRLSHPKVYGEATATYARLKESVIADIVALNPDLRGILMVRDPVERAWSHAKKEIQKAGLAEDVAENYLTFIKRNDQSQCADYKTMAARWSRHLKPGRLYFADYRRITTDPLGLRRDICLFLGVSPDVMRKTRHLGERVNTTGGTSMPPEVKKYLESRFAQERLEAEELIKQPQATY